MFSGHFCEFVYIEYSSIALMLFKKVCIWPTIKQAFSHNVKTIETWYYISLFLQRNTPQKSNQDWKLITETLTGMPPKAIISSKKGKHVDLCFSPQPASFFSSLSCYFLLLLDIFSHFFSRVTTAAFSPQWAHPVFTALCVVLSSDSKQVCERIILLCLIPFSTSAHSPSYRTIGVCQQ